MWISKKRFEEMEYRLKSAEVRLDSLIGSQYRKSDTASTAWMKDITLEDLARFCIDGKPIEKPVNPEIKVRIDTRHGDYPEYGYYKRGDVI